MNRNALTPIALAAVLACLPAPSQACSEGMFNTGKGLTYRGYLAPRPAQVLVYATAPKSESDMLYAGLEKAGHTVTVVHDEAALATALGQQRYDVVITALDGAEQVTANAGAGDNAPRLLPVVARSARNEPQVRDRFEVFLIDGASLGQYLGGINKVLKAGTR